MKKIIVDTSWWISFVLSKYPVKLPGFFSDETIDFYFYSESLNEINSTLSNARSRKRIKQINLQEFIRFIEASAVFVEARSSITICREPKDNFLLALAKDAGADYLITRDEDLLTLKQFEKQLF